MNSVALIGRLTKEPDVRYTNDMKAVAHFTLAVDRPVPKGIDKQTDFPRIVAFGKTAELIEQYVHKGERLGVLGRIQTGSYTKDGRTVYTTDVVADRITLLSSRSDNAVAEDQISGGVYDGFEAVDDELPF